MARCTPAPRGTRPHHAGTPSTRKPGGLDRLARLRKAQRQATAVTRDARTGSQTRPRTEAANKPGDRAGRGGKGRGQGTAGRQRTGHSEPGNRVTGVVRTRRSKAERNERFTSLMPRDAEGWLGLPSAKGKGGYRRRRVKWGSTRARRWQIGDLHRRVMPAGYRGSRRGGSTSRRRRPQGARIAHSGPDRQRAWWRC